MPQDCNASGSTLSARAAKISTCAPIQPPQTTDTIFRTNVSTQAARMPHHRHQRGDTAAVIAAVRAGQSVRQVATKFGVSRSLVYGICRKEGISLRPSISDALRQTIIDEAHHGATTASLMRKYRIGYHRIHAILDRAGRQPLKNSSRRLLRALALLKNTSMTFAQIGRNLGTSTQRIHQIYTDARNAGIRFVNRSGPTAPRQRKKSQRAKHL